MITRNQKRVVENAEWRLHHHYLQGRQLQHEQKVARRMQHVDKEWEWGRDKKA
jgi:hypothetical protein